MKQLEISRVRCLVCSETAGVVSSNWGVTLRGGFGAALRELTCSTKRPRCADCELNSVCAYGYLFETPINTNAPVMRKYTNAPHPFVFEPPANSPTRIAEGESAEITVVLVGRAVDYLPYILLALQKLGAQGLGRDRVRFRLDQIRSEQGDVIYSMGKGSAVGQPPCRPLSLEPGPSRIAQFEIRFLSPVRIQSNGRISTQPSLKDIVSSLARRVFLLSQFHSREPVAAVDSVFLDAADAATLLRSETRWMERERYSTRQKRGIPIGGAMGRLVFSADYGLLQPLLRVGEYVHVGKNASFGLGQFELMEVTQS